MKTALEKINNIALNEVSPWKKEAMERKQNSEQAQRSFKIALRILREIRLQKPLNGMSQKKLAHSMGVSPQYINKLIKGKENLTLETVAKIETVLGITLLEVPAFETSKVLYVKPEQFKYAISSIGAIPISDNVWSYNNNFHSYATGTYG